MPTSSIALTATSRNVQSREVICEPPHSTIPIPSGIRRVDAGCSKGLGLWGHNSHNEEFSSKRQRVC